MYSISIELVEDFRPVPTKDACVDFHVRTPKISTNIDIYKGFPQRFCKR